GSPVDDTILSRYAVIPSHDVTNIGQGGEWVIAEIGPADSGYDTRFVIGEQLNGQTDFDADLIIPLVKAFTASGQKLNDPSQLLPFATTAEQRRVVEEWIQRFPNLQKGLAEPHTTIQMQGWK
ncbi:MAG TPA: hypothetical protein VK327_09405, partial [Candidatus Paceibacterota bacterium]|nr:hypothetical protein [Candidatus Paceibacterota bacterium]